MDLVNNIIKYINTSKKINLILTGGNSPLKDYRLLFKKNLNWEKINFFFTDERLVPISSNHSNYKAVSKILKKNKISHYLKPLCANSALRPQVDQTIKLLKKHITICILGVGDDGHFASIFTNSNIYKKLIDLKNRPNIMITEKLGKPSYRRITMNLSMLLLSTKIFILVNSKNKIKLFKKILKANNAKKYSITSLLNNAKDKILIYDGSKTYKLKNFNV